MKYKELKVPISKPRNPTVPHLMKRAAGEMQDKKKLAKAGYEKHKTKCDEELDEGKKPKGAPDWHDSDAPDAEGRFKNLGINDLADWLIKTRNKDMRKITGALNQQIVFNRKQDPNYAEKMEKVRAAVKRKLGIDK